MARITVEDCLERVDNLFELVLMASRRAQRLANGAEPMVPRENDKPTVIALREIAGGHITREILDQDDAAEEAEEADQLLDELVQRSAAMSGE